MNNKNLHSFAIMAFKNAPFLEETIKSILSQKMTSKVYISTSTPTESIKYLAELYNLPLYINKKRLGIAADWKFALSCSETQYVTLVDQDDIYLPNYADTIINLISSRSDSLIAFSDYLEIDKNNMIRKSNITMTIKKIMLWPFIFSNSIKGKFRKSMICFGDPICSPSVTYNLNNLDISNIFDADFCVSLDWNAWLEMTNKKGAFCYCRRKLIKHRIHESTQTSEGISAGKRYNEDLKVLRKMWPNSIAVILAKLYSLSYRTNK